MINFYVMQITDLKTMTIDDVPKLWRAKVKAKIVNNMQQAILNSAGYLEKGVLTEDDLSEINEAIENQYKVKTTQEEIVEEEPATEENIEATEVAE